MIFCSSYNGAPPDNATKFVDWLQNAAAPDAFRRRALHGVRLRQPRVERRHTSRCRA